MKSKNLVKKSSNLIKDLSMNTLNFMNPLNLTKLSTKSTSEKIGKSPGTLIYSGKERKEKVKIELIDYTSKDVIKKEAKSVEDLLKYKNKKSTTWINVIGVHDINVIKRIGELYDIHPLILEDIVNTHSLSGF